jgi:hypothetical protein
LFRRLYYIYIISTRINSFNNLSRQHVDVGTIIVEVLELHQ